VSAKIDPVEVASMCRYPKCDVCGADAKADATPRTEMSDVKRWWVFKEQLLDEKVHRFDSEGAIPVVLASDLDAEVAAHEMTAHELKCAEAERDEALLKIQGHLDMFKRYRERSDAILSERDDERARHLITQRKLAEMWAERDRLAATVERVRALRNEYDGLGLNAGIVCAIDRALAEPVEATYPLCRECGKWKQP